VSNQVWEDKPKNSYESPAYAGRLRRGKAN
jgi:hypothetical protein